jgi:predicted RNase H-like HicB family nuclease/DNA-binding Xre family transcriptional regulator
MKINLNYPAKITRKKDGYFVIFRDIENCFSEADSYEEIIANAQDVLGAMLKSMAKHNENLPLASEVKKNEIMISPYPEVAAPLELYILRKLQGKTVDEVAKRLGVTKQRYSEIERGKNLTLKTLRKVAEALGATADVSVWAY